MNDFYSKKRVLVTGASGFKGSWLSIWLHMMGAEVFGYSLAPKNSYDNYPKCQLDDLMAHETNDIRDQEALNKFVQRVQPEIVFHLAAQPLVLYSYANPKETYETNVTGTLNVLEAVRNCKSTKVCLVITTDKVYENDGSGNSYKETDKLGGYDPYSSSKACCEILTASYASSFFQKEKCNIATARAGNVIGAGDWAENRIVPDFYRAKQANAPLQIRNASAIRPWQFVLEPLNGYLMLAKYLGECEGNMSGAWNFGPNPNDDHAVSDVIEELKKQVSVTIEYTDNSHLKESEVLKLNSTKAKETLNWRTVLSFEETLRLTHDGYISDLKNEKALDNRMEQIKLFEKLRSNGK